MQPILLTIASLLLVATMCVHSVLGQRRLIRPLLDEGHGVMQRPLARFIVPFAWHLTSLIGLIVVAILFAWAWAPDQARHHRPRHDRYCFYRQWNLGRDWQQGSACRLAAADPYRAVFASGARDLAWPTASALRRETCYERRFVKTGRDTMRIVMTSLAVLALVACEQAGGNDQRHERGGRQHGDGCQCAWMPIGTRRLPD